MKQCLLDLRDPEIRPPVIDDLRAEAARRGWAMIQGAPAGIQGSDVSRCLDDDFLMWIDEGKRRLRMQRDWRKNPAISRRWAAALHSVRRYPMCETFACVVPGGRVYQRGGAVFTPQNELINESHVLTWNPRRSEWPPKPGRKLAGRVLNLAVAYADSNITHFTIDSALRATMFDTFEGMTCLATPAFRRWHYEMFELLGIRREQIVFTDDLFTECEELVICKTSDRSVIPHIVHLREFRRRIMRNAGVGEAAVNPRRRIYISRAKDKRSLVNEEAAWPLFAERGFEKVFCQDLSLRENVRLFAEAEVVAGPHGSGFINTIFCPPGTKVIELHNPFWWDASTASYGQMLGIEYWHGFCGWEGDPSNSWIDIRKLNRLLDHALGGSSAEPLPH